MYLIVGTFSRHFQIMLSTENVILRISGNFINGYLQRYHEFKNVKSVTSDREKTNKNSTSKEII